MNVSMNVMTRTLLLALGAISFAALAHGQQPTLVKDIRSGASSSSPEYMTVFQNKLIFAADDGQNGRELWESDGTDNGTRMIGDITPGSNGNNPYAATYSNYGWDRQFPIVGNTFYYRGYDPNYGSEIWVSDGTQAGTRMVRDIRSGSSSSGIAYMTKVGNDRIYFRARDNSYGYELWYAQGTNATRVTDIYGGGSHSYANYVTEVNGQAFFQARHPSYDYELWRADSNNNYYLVEDIFSGGNNSDIAYICEMNNVCYFRARNDNNNYELWRSEGSSNNTNVVTEIRSGNAGSYPEHMQPHENLGLLFFSAEDDTHGRELWVSDGTANGTRMVKDINPAGSSSPYGMTVVGDKIYFRAYHPNFGDEIWVSDGTEAGTRMVRDVRTGPNGSSPEWFADINGSCYFSAHSDNEGRELWKVLPSGGAKMVSDLFPGPNSSSPQYLRYLNGYCYFNAENGQNGRELFRVAIPPEVVDTTPAVNANDAPANTSIAIENSQPVVNASVDSSTFLVHASLNGAIQGTYAVMNEDVTFSRTGSFAPGETVEVTLTGAFENSFMISSDSPYVYRFRVEAGQGPARFDNVLLTPVGSAQSQTTDVIAGDFNGDGSIDVAFVLDGGQNYVALNDGNGGFSTTSSFGPSNSPSSGIAAADFDADGDLDLVVVNRGGENAVYLNDGSGDMTQRLPFGPGNDQTTGVDVGDMDGDGSIDIVVANFTQQNLVLFNDGSGAFNDVVSFGTGFDDSTAVATGDITGDGKLDIVLANQLNPGKYYVNDGEGNFDANGAERDYGAGVSYATAVAVGDLNNDGTLDIVSANLNRKNAVYWNDGAGDFNPMATEFDGFNPTRDVALLDVNGDGYLDIAFANAMDQNEVLLNDTMGGFGVQNPVDFGTGMDASVALAYADFDNDDDLDLAIANLGGASTIAPNQVSVPASPTITSTAPDAATVGQAYSYTVLTTGVPAPTISVSGLPSWLAFTGGDTISGTPNQSAVGTTGVITVEAINGSPGPSAIQQFSITVNPAPSAPSITSAPPANAAAGQSFSYSVMADGFPAPTFSLSGAPAWMSLSGSTLSGTPTTGDIGQTGMISVTASNSEGSDTQTFQLNVSLQEAPYITSLPIRVATVGQQYSYTIVSGGSPSPTITVSGAPAWLSLNNNILSGVPTAADAGASGIQDTGTITISASNNVGAPSSQDFVITVTDPNALNAPRISSVPLSLATVGQAYSYTVTAEGSPAPSVAVSGLPAWLSWDAATQVISGTPAAADVGVSAVITVSAENSLNQISEQTFQILVSPVASSSSSSDSSCALTAGSSGNAALWLLALLALCSVVVVRRRTL